jgi:hypothetical protein
MLKTPDDRHCRRLKVNQLLTVLLREASKVLSSGILAGPLRENLWLHTVCRRNEFLILTLCAVKVKQMPAFAYLGMQYSVKMLGLELNQASCLS